MAQYTTTQEPEHNESWLGKVASPTPLGLSIFAFATAIIGCYYAGFIIPRGLPTLHIILGAVLLVAGIIQVLAGMWEYRRNAMLTATIFTSYGGFLTAIGLAFILGFGIVAAVLGPVLLSHVLGLFFICWAIYSGVLLIGTLRTNASLVTIMALLFAAFVLLTIGALSVSAPVLIAGGWVAIACALFTWLVAIASILGAESANELFRLPLGHRIAPVE